MITLYDLCIKSIVKNFIPDRNINDIYNINELLPKPIMMDIISNMSMYNEYFYTFKMIKNIQCFMCDIKFTLNKEKIKKVCVFCDGDIKLCSILYPFSACEYVEYKIKFKYLCCNICRNIIILNDN
ncbi:hypothetical protein AHEV_116 [Adoxophyes honmai entomopoxvirus 'L']|uniref:Uncharacterized protein n=1 Tax=Adoxophyes honmai entomopoxvirus 'L' TaxID=1293540 RepID=A0A916NWT9_9POXV|nr:hypothetical protein AHEV_116 [Adoxophyes honmai entomopoxvirus 'L']CCU55437.1 hypothetical protein AHEV_116 [Adoxophyes honmai entomopoxvirus 'L']